MLRAAAEDSSARPIRILIADDERLFAEALMIALGTDPRFEVVAHALDGRDALQLAAAFQPDVILIDVEMPVLNGLEATRQVRALAPNAQVVIVNASDEAREIERALEAGAAGCISRAQTADALFAIVSDAAKRQSGTFLWPTAAVRTQSARRLAAVGAAPAGVGGELVSRSDSCTAK